VLPPGNEADGLQSHGHHHSADGTRTTRLQESNELQEGVLRCCYISKRADPSADDMTHIPARRR